MQAGRLNRRCVIQVIGTGFDTIGQPVDTWTDSAVIWGNVRHLNGTESIKAGGVTSAVQASIRIRYNAGINAGMRAVVEGRVYQIKAVMPDMQKREFTDLVCEFIS